jgi:hypothetical protein
VSGGSTIRADPGSGYVSDEVGSRQGGEAAAILYSLLHTAKANGLEPYAYLVDVLTRINSTKTSEINSLLPFAATAEIE